MNQWRKGIASWTIGKTLYISVPFTWLMAEAEEMARQHKGKALIGGPGTMQRSVCSEVEPILFHNPLATFTTRGCPNKCGFCAVPKLEGDFREIKNFRPAPMVCDNNFLAASKHHFLAVLQTLKQFPYVDFNQGLDARLFTEWHALMLSGLHHVKVRFSMDNTGMADTVFKAVELARFHGLKDIGIYCLIGFNDTPQSAKERLELVRSWGIRPNPMRYQPLDSTEKNSYVAPGWTEKELRKMTKYYSRLGWLGNVCTYDEYDYLRHDPGQKELAI